jgi:hypothetical protein
MVMELVALKLTVVRIVAVKLKMTPIYPPPPSSLAAFSR